MPCGKLTQGHPGRQREGRVRYFPLCEYRGDARFDSLIFGEEYEVAAGKVVDTTYMNVTVPSVSPAQA